MASPHDETPPLLIRCPSCGQRFKVGADLRDRTVECGACESRFRINDDVIMRSRKFYPGERPEPGLNRYQRVPLATASVPENLMTARYTDHPDPLDFEPVSPQRLVAGAAAVVAFVLMAMLLFFGASTGAALDGMSTVKRLTMAGFTTALVTALLFYANRRSRSLALLFSAGCGAVLLGLPLVRTEGSELLRPAETTAGVARPQVPVPSAGDERVSKLRERFGTEPLVLEQGKQSQSGGGRHAYGLWLDGLMESNKLLVRDYMLRAAGADPSSHLYPRGQHAYLMVVTGLDLDIEGLSQICKPLGEVGAIHAEIGVIEVQVDNANFVPGSLEKMSNPAEPAFYELNKRELESIDLSRVKGAVERLGVAAPKLYRPDISRRLVHLLKEDGVEFKDLVCAALLVWDDELEAAGAAAEVAAKQAHADGTGVPRQMVALMVKAKQVSAVPLVDELWAADPDRWEESYAAFGPVVEPSVIRRFPEVKNTGRFSAVRILGKVGGKDSVKMLEMARPGAEAELALRIDTALKDIRARQGE